MRDGILRKNYDTEAFHHGHAKDCQRKHCPKDPPCTSLCRRLVVQKPYRFRFKGRRKVNPKILLTFFPEEAAISKRRNTLESIWRTLITVIPNREKRHAGPTCQVIDIPTTVLPLRKDTVATSIEKIANPLSMTRYYLEHPSLRSPRAIEECLKKAFKKKKGSSYGKSPHSFSGANPIDSSLTTTARTPLEREEIEGLLLVQKIRSFVASEMVVNPNPNSSHPFRTFGECACFRS